MKVTVAKSAGFCFGVKRAVDTVYSLLDEGKKVYTVGQLIHNDEVTGELAAKGVTILQKIEDAQGIGSGSIVIRAHGIEKAEGDYLMNLCEKSEGRLEVVDATCPYVKKIHRIVEKESADGKKIIIVGSRDHPEVRGIIGWCHNEACVIENADEAEAVLPDSKNLYCVVSQTTYNYKKFEELVEILNKKLYYVNVVNTICTATEERQQETRELASVSDGMIVIGGVNSSNTRKLFEIAQEECKKAYLIQKLSDLDKKQFESLLNVGITAGASTPNKIIKEVFKVMSEENFAEMLEESLRTIHNGEVVEGTVIRVKEDEIALNIGYKADGIITRSEYTNTPNLDLTTVVNEGDVLQAKVLKVNDGEGQVLLTYKRLAQERGSKRLEEAFENKEVLKAKVVAVLGGGLSVVIDETRVFIPASLVSDSFEKNLDKYKDQEIEFVITEFNPKKRRIIGDRKKILVEKKKAMLEELFSKIQVGDVVQGIVKNVTDFGAFIDIGGADGLLHISEMSWGRVENPKKVFKVGDSVRAFIKDIQGEKIALSMKFPDQNPWADAETRFAKGNIVEGKIARMTDFGAFVELVPGVDALLHVSQISKDRVEKPADVLKIGQTVTAKIVEFNLADKKISLSIKQLEAPAAEEEEAAAPAEAAEDNQ